MKTRKGTPIICHICGWQPKSKHKGGLRWKLMALHLVFKHRSRKG